ncbi:23 kDa integral membrane protein [Hydra vulgaris]|uniref:23 kDa integral membrane protein n=1 Tax=Hydra vulgaris TaxID=6087 RepID=UPI00064145BE|nr:23 kDa integral membrane protein [Hydra vulgaris]
MRGNQMFANIMCMNACVGCFFGAIFLVAGLTIIVLGILIKINFEYYIVYSENKNELLPWSIIGIGFTILFAGLLGCFGAIKGNMCVLGIFLILLFTIFVSEIAVGSMAFIYSSKIEAYTDNRLKNAVDVFDNSSSSRKFLDWAHEKFSCCGYLGPSDFNNATDLKLTCGYNNGLPSCHRKMNCKKILFTDGCNLKFLNFIKQNIVIAGGVVFGLSLMQLIGIVCSSVLGCVRGGRDYGNLESKW